MKYLKITNWIAIILPIFLLILGLFNDIFVFFAMFSLVITGFLQIVVALGYWYLNPKSKNVKIYLILVIIYFLTAFMPSIYNFEALPFFMLMPIFLGGYLTILIHSKK